MTCNKYDLNLNKAQLAKMSPMVSQMFLTWVQKYRCIGTGDIGTRQSLYMSTGAEGMGPGTGAKGTGTWYMCMPRYRYRCR